MTNPTFTSADGLLGDLLAQAMTISDARRERANLLGSRRGSIADACRRLGAVGIRELDLVPLPEGFRSAAVDGAHVCDVDSSTSVSISLAFALESGGKQTSSACLSSFGHLFGLEDISCGLMFMQEIMLATALARSDPSLLVVVDGARVSTLIALDAFYRACAVTDSPLPRWRAASEAQPGRIVNAFEDEESDWLYHYLTAPNIVASTKLVTSRRLCETLPDRAEDPSLAEVLRDIDDRTVAEIALADLGDGEPGEGMGPIPLRPPRTPFGVRSGGARGYPRPDRVDEALQTLTDSPAGADMSSAKNIGFHTYYMRPLPGRPPFSVEVNEAFWKSPVAETLAVGREGDDFTRAMRGIAAYLREETPSSDIMEPYLVHVADRLAKASVTSAKAAWDFVSRSQPLESDLGWRLFMPHRT